MADLPGRITESDEPNESIWGPAPGEGDLAAARRAGAAAVDAALTVALSGALTEDQAALRLGISRQALSKRRTAGGLVELRRGGECHFPFWQFYEGGLLPGLADLIAAYPGTDLALTTWALEPNPDLDGLTPAAALTRSEVDRVLAAVRPLQGH